MADITINNLPDLAVTGTNHLVHTNGTTTGKATVTQLRTALNIPAAQIQSDWNQANSGSLDFIKNKPIVGLQGVQGFGPGSYTFTVPAGVTRVRATCIGGGGGGQSGYRTGTGPRSPGVPTCGAVGGGGGAAIYVFTVTPGTTMSVSVGGGGAGGSGGSRRCGGSGGSTSVSYDGVSVAGGGGGCGSPGSGSSGSVNLTGTGSQPAIIFSGYGYGGGPGCDSNVSGGSGAGGFAYLEW